MPTTMPTATPEPAAAGVRVVRAPPGDIGLMDWLGRPLDCAGCPHQDLLGQAGGCEPGHSCMQDAYARRIDRFFRNHRERADQHLEHPYFEVRAIAARYADLFHLSPLLRDPDETVRLQVALRVPQRLLLGLCDDPHREVRIRVALRLAPEELGRLMHDPDYEVRNVVARRLPLGRLGAMVADADEQVRRTVAGRLEMPALWRMAADPSPTVRRLVAQRAPLPLLPQFAGDPDWAVRWELADRLDLATAAARALLRGLAENDTDPEVRARAGERLAPAAVRALPGPTSTLHCPTGDPSHG